MPAIRVYSCTFVVLFFSSLFAPAASFDEQRAAMSGAVSTQPEAAIVDLLKSGLDESKPTQAFAEAQKWLRQNLSEDAMLLYYAARCAELSGDARAAAALYQQYLKKADPKSDTTGVAVIAIHALLRDQLNDTAGAFSFGRSDGDRLAVNPAARQFDQWFLDQATRRQDALAVAKRLHACIKAGLPDEVLETYYSDYFRWLLGEVDSYLERGRTVPVSAELVDAYKQLSAAITFDKELALQLDWAVSVREYNLSRIGGDGSQRGKKPKKDAAVDEAEIDLGEGIAPPIAEATALLSKYPSNAQWVQSGWAGGGNGQYYRNDPAKYWPHEIDAKMAPVVAAAAKLTPLQLADLLGSWHDGYFQDKFVRPLQVKAVRDYVAANPKLTNSRTGVLLLEKPWNKLTPEEAKALAPQIAGNPHPEASLVRAIATGGAEKDLDKMIAALLGSEAWRLGAAELDSRYADQLWHYAGRPGDSARRDQEIAKSKALAANIKAATPTKDAAPAQRLALFKKLWADYRSRQPKIPGVVGQLKAVLLITPEMIPELLRDSSPEAQILARDAMAAGISGADPIWVEIEASNRVNVSSYAPGILYLAQRHAGGKVDDLKKRYPLKCQPHPLEAAMRKSVTDGLKQNKLELWQIMAWINMQYPEDNAEQVKLMQALFKSPLWKTMPYETHYAARQWFKKDAMTPAQAVWIDAADPELVCKDLLALEREAETAEEKNKRDEAAKADPDAAAAAAAEAAKTDVAAATAALQSTIDGLRKAPLRVGLPAVALENLAALDPSVLGYPEVLELGLQLIDQLKAAPVAINFGNRLIDVATKTPDPDLLHRTAPYFWRHVNANVRSFTEVKALTIALVDEHPSAASALALAGLDAIARHRGHTYYVREVDIPLFKSIRGKAAMKMGLVVIPVAKSAPSYPIYRSQADWLTGNEDSASGLLDESWEQLVAVHRELAVPYLMWALQRVVYSRDDARQEELIKALLAWAGEATTPLSPTEKVNLEIAYGDIAVQRGQLKEAHEIFTRTQKNEAYKDLLVRHQATLRRAGVERLAKDFDGALQTLSELELERVPEIWSETRYARAEVNFDMEEFEDAKDDIDSILAREPNHPDAKILLGKVQLKRQKLMEATEVELGSTSGQKSIVPGEKLKVTLSDPTLAVSGAGTEIEVVVWAKSGDKETFFLRQFGDQKTKFRGEVATALGAPEPGDKKLQVIGDDEIYYAYSERFRTRMNNMAEKRGGPITVASDGLLMASARKLLTEAEQRVADMQKIMEELKNEGVKNAEGSANARMAAEALSADARAGDGARRDFQEQITTVVKPGNPINVRVIDPDRSRTAEIDELTVSVGSSSGDAVARVMLKETATHSGWFEGSIATAGAQALAFAQNSEPGRNPNMVISPSVDSYPAWRPVAAKGVTPEFTVDLNDNAALGDMTITAQEVGAKLKTFVLQTGMNARNMTTVAAYPKSQGTIEQPWRPSVTVMNDTDRYQMGGRSVYDLGELVEQVGRGWMTQQYAQGFASNVNGPSEALPEPVLKEVKWLRQNRHDVSSVIYRFRGYFYEEADVKRRFRLSLGNFVIPKDTHPSLIHPPQFLLAVDGRPITEKDGKLEGEMNLRPGVHRFEIWATGWVNNMGFGKRGVKLQSNLDDPDMLVDCPDSFFDPASFPEGVMDQRNSPATITANEDGTEFKVKFASGSRGRLLKLAFIAQEGTVPALNQLALTTPDGKAILPVAEDFATLNKNNTLEILTGDKISVLYVDDRFVTKKKERHERFLSVAFTDARAEFADMEPRWSQKHGEDMPYYERLLRFRHDQPLSLAIHDADMDVSVKPDTVKVTLKSEAGDTRQFDATETGDSTGVFKLVVTPVAGAAVANQISVNTGGTITASYLDRENNRPGVPTERVATIVHAAFTLPQLHLSHANVTPVEAEAMRPLVHGFERRDYRGPEKNELASESVLPRWMVENTLLPSTETPEGGLAVVHGRRMYLELVAPHLALGMASKVEVYAQTDTGRRQATAAGVGDATFNISAPGTISLSGGLGATTGYGDLWRMVPELQIYQGGGVTGSNGEQFDRFRMSVPLVAGTLPENGVLSAVEREELVSSASTSFGAAEQLYGKLSGLVVNPGERVHFGFRYTDGDGKKQWLTASTKVITHPVFDIMAEDYRSTIGSAYVGETLNLRVVDLGADLSDAIDTVSILLQAKSGAKYRVELRESAPHTGIFKAGYALSYAKAQKTVGGEATAEYNVRRDGFPVIYGDTVAARYTDASGIKSPINMITISKGADGTIQPFTKKYQDPEVAMRTQFSLAEAYLEMAKRHRKLGETERAEQEYSSAKQLLASAMDQFRDPDTRANAEYLLGNLTLEEADATEAGELKEDRYRAALSRFMTVTGSYAETLHASKAQFKIATVYEKLNEPDIAAQEYVKLAYKYPDSEFLATAMARLGSHFLKKAAGYEAQAKPLLAKEDDKDAQFEGEAMQKMATREYLKTANI
ncbi:MAG: tetratricopeptide (TPR) repeat protein, partial [Pseudoalteromonas tetraodonis]